jgi:predicted 3-demethylubiquinone-9 3-methyltransferase (glyoxalase superfamily)
MTVKQKITTFLWFDGQAKEAAEFYCSLFKDSKIIQATPMVVTFQLTGLKFLALNGGPQFKFTEAVSLFVDCDSQEEVDTLWNALTANGGEESMCGWLKDKYGLSWQIIPSTLMELMSDKDQAKAGRVMQAMLKMRKINVQALEDAYNSN